MPILAIANLKGGVGKSTLSQNLSVCLSQWGKTVCLIDTDTEQRSSAEWGQRRQAAGYPTLDIFVVNEDNLATKITEVAQQYEFVVVDGSPALSEITTKIVLISDLVVVPVLPSGNDFGALEKFLSRYNETRTIQKRHGIETAGLGIVLNEYDHKTIVNRTILQAIERLDFRVCETRIAHRVAYKEANLTGAGVTELLDRKASGEMEGLLHECFKFLNYKIK
jgi:chromosome partitioning protein